MDTRRGEVLWRDSREKRGPGWFLSCLLVLGVIPSAARAEDRPAAVQAIRLWKGLGHWDGGRSRIRGVAFRPDGAQLASSSARVVELWDPSTGRKVRTLREPEGWIAALEFSPDGEVLVTAGERPVEGDAPNASGSSYEGFVRLWSPDAGELVRTAAVEQRIACLDVSSKGDLLALGFSSRSRRPPGDDPRRPTVVEVRSLKTLQVLHSFQASAPGVRSIALSPDGTRLAAAAGNSGSVLVWSLESGELLHEVTEGQRRVSSVAWNPRLPLLAAGSFDGSVTLWSSETGEEVRTLRWPLDGELAVPIESVAFSADGTTLAAGSAESPRDADAVALWWVDSGKRVATSFSGRRETIHDLVFSPDGKTLAAGDSDGTVRVWSVESGQPWPWPGTGHTDRVLSVALSADGRTLASSGRDRTLRLWSLESGEEVGSWPTPENTLARKLSLRQGGKLLACVSLDAADPGSRTGTVHLVSLEDGESRELEGGNGASDVVFSPDGRRLAASFRGAGTVKVWDVETGEESLAISAHAHGPFHLDWSADGKALVSTGRAAARSWSSDTGKRRALFQEHYTGPRSPWRVVGPLHGAVWSAALGRDGRLAASAGWLSLKLWSAEDGKALRDLAAHRHWITSLAFSPDGDLLASADMDGLLVLWETASGDPRHAWKLPGATRLLGFAGEGERLVTANPNGTVSLLDVPKPAERVVSVLEARAYRPPAARRSVEQGRLRMSLLVTSDEFYFDNFLVDVLPGPNGEILFNTMAGAIYSVSPAGKARVVAEMYPVRSATSVLRDPRSGRLKLTVRGANCGIYEIREGRLVPLLLDRALFRVEESIPGPDGGLIVTENVKESVLGISAAGEMQVLARSPGLIDLRGLLRDSWDSALVVAAQGNLFRATDDGRLEPLIGANRSHPLASPNRLAQDVVSGDYFVVDELASLLSRVDRQGSARRISRLPGRPVGLAREEPSGDLIISVNFAPPEYELKGILRLSGHTTVPESELDDWLGVLTPEALVP